MAKIVFGDVAYPLSGETAPTVPNADTLFLLNAKGVVISASKQGNAPLVGESFFQHVALSEQGEEELLSFLAQKSASFLLLAGACGPVLFSRALFDDVGLLLACVPDKARGEALCYLDKRALSSGDTLLVSRELYKRMSDAGNADVLLDLLATYRILSSLPHKEEMPSAELLCALSRLAVDFSAWCKVPVTYDFCGVGLSPVRECRVAQAAALMLSACLLSARLGTGVHFFVDKEEFDSPVLHALLKMPDRTDTLPEMEALHGAMRERGRPLRLWYEQGEEALLHVAGGFCGKELSYQQLRAFEMPQ